MARNNHFGGFGGGANMQQLMRQAQKLQSKCAQRALSLAYSSAGQCAIHKSVLYR